MKSTHFIWICVLLTWSGVSHADPSPDDYPAFIRAEAAKLRARDKAPQSLAEWRQQREILRKNLLDSWGGFPEVPCPLDPKILGKIQRDGYRIEKIVFQTRPNVWMTANAYVPDKAGKLPALLMVHGHWRGAKQDPTVQARCIGAARHGFFVLVVDAFGAGERGGGKALGEYHGEMTAATLLPTGLPLSGLQLYENMRAVDYLKSRPEVDGDRLGISGASGGGNQTMYAGSWDDRFKAVVPVCSVGNYQVYLRSACCMCEVVPGALRFTDEWGVLGMTAPRGLMVVSATKDAIQFSVAEAKKSFAFLEPVFGLYEKPAQLRHTLFESPHDYNKAMREAMYGWMALQLRGEGDGSPLPEPAFKAEEPESLRCYPGESRPADWMTIPRFAATQGRELVARIPAPASIEACKQQTDAMRAALVETVLGGFPKLGPPTAKLTAQHLDFEPEPGIHLRAQVERSGKGVPLVLLLNLDGADKARTGTLAKEIRQAGWDLITCDLRATGALALPKEKVGRAPDHHSAEWALWLGRPLLGQWTYDVRRLLDALEDRPKEIIVIGEGPAGIVALCAAATDSRITRVAAVGSLASYISETPYEGQRLGLMAPGILRDVGDVAHLAALSAPRRVVVAGPVTGAGTALTEDERRGTFEPAIHTWNKLRARSELQILRTTEAAQVVAALK